MVAPAHRRGDGAGSNCLLTARVTGYERVLESLARMIPRVCKSLVLVQIREIVAYDETECPPGAQRSVSAS